MTTQLPPAGPAELHVGLLGPFEVRVAGEPVGPAGARRRGLLALLALESGVVVPVETLVDRLWGDDPPASAVNVVQTYVSAWRRVLGGREGVLRTVGAGYSLVIDDERCDYARFRTLSRAARDLAAGGDLAEAERMLGRGPGPVAWPGPGGPRGHQHPRPRGPPARGGARPGCRGLGRRGPGSRPRPRGDPRPAPGGVVRGAAPRDRGRAGPAGPRRGGTSGGRPGDVRDGTAGAAGRARRRPRPGSPGAARPGAPRRPDPGPRPVC